MHANILEGSSDSDESPGHSSERSKICRLPEECFDADGCLRLSDAIRHMVENNLPHGRR